MRTLNFSILFVYLNFNKFPTSEFNGTLGTRKNELGNDDFRAVWNAALMLRGNSTAQCRRGITRAAERHVAHLPSRLVVHRVAPRSVGELPVRVAAEIVGLFDAAVRERRRVGVAVLVRRLRRPVLTHLAADGRPHQTAIRTRLRLQLARYSSRNDELETVSVA